MNIKKNLLLNPIHQPIVRPFGKRLYQLWEEYRLDDVEVKIDRLFVFDGASIPRVLWFFVGSRYLPKYMLPALVHDFLLRDGRLGRLGADRQFKKYLRLNGVGLLLSELLFIGVRLGSWVGWNKYRKLQREGGDPVYALYRSKVSR